LSWPASAKLTTQAFYEIASGVARRRQSRIGDRTRLLDAATKVQRNVSFVRDNEEKMLHCAF
jgi:hypothetical protein